MAVKITPQLTIGGIPLACTADVVDTEPVAVRELEITWGRSEYHDSSATPASMTLYLLDSTGEWADLIRRGKAIGQEVYLDWRARPVDRGGGHPADTRAFRGRVSRATATITPMESAQGARRWLITLVCADSTAAMGGVNPGPSVWPTEAMIDRALRIKGLSLAGSAGIKDFYFRSNYHMFGVSPLDVKSKNALQLMGEFYASMGAETWAYDPHGNVVRQVPRLSQDMSVRLQSGDEQYGGVLPAMNDVTFEGVTYPGIGLGGCQLRGQPMIEADPATHVNRLEANWSDREREWDDAITVYENVYPGDARRVLTWDTWLGDEENVIPAQNALWARVFEEGSRPKHPEFTTPATHIFPNLDVAKWVLMAWENPRPAFISGDAAHQWLMGENNEYGPIVAPIGGSLHFDPKKGWSGLFRAQFIHNSRQSWDGPVSWSMIRQERQREKDITIPWMWVFEGVPDDKKVIDSSTIKVTHSMPNRNLEWGPPAPKTGYRFHTSVTWEDLRHITHSGAQIKDNYTT